VDLIKRENIDNDRVKNYIRILDEKSQRLKQLTVDLVEASKITSGNITLEITRMNVTELINQAQGEFEEKFNEKGLSLITSLPQGAVVIEADPRYIWRIVENLLQNVYKYAMPDTRVYLDVERDEINKNLVMSFKNISAQQLNIKASELTERFIRGDVARSSEGSGLGLSIVKSLVKAHNGNFEVYLDGDLFKATVTLPLVNESSVNNNTD
jgi:signal transduction histidine kinase